jgi:hypothetical protein
MTAKQTRQPLLSNGFTNKHVAMATRGYNSEELSFLCGPCRDVISNRSVEWNTSAVVPASRKRRQKGNPVPGSITGPPCSWSPLRYQIFWEVVGLERGPLSLVSTIEELLERKRSGSSLENRDDGHRNRPRWPHDTPLFSKVVTNFADKRRSLSRYSSLAY